MSLPAHPNDRSLRATTSLARILLAVIVGLAGAFEARAGITGVSATEVTAGSVFEVTGTGFGTSKPKVTFADDGEPVPGVKLKVLESSDTELTVRVKKATVGRFSVMVVPETGAPSESVDMVDVVPPAVVAVETEAKTPGDVATATVEWPSSGKTSVSMGWLPAKILSITPTVGEGPEPPPTAIVTFRIPKKLPNGHWAVEFSNGVGSVMSDDAVEVVGSKRKLKKGIVRASIVGRKLFTSTKVGVTASQEGPTTIVGFKKKGDSWSLELPFVYGTDLAPTTFDGTEAEVRFVDAKSGEEFESGDDLSVRVSATGDGIVAGSFGGTFRAVADAMDTRLASGTFSYDGTYDLEGTPGLTDTVLVPGEEAPPLNVQILAIQGATGPTGNFRPGDRMEVRFRLAKDDGTVWKLSEMSMARAMISGPTENYQRVIVQQTNVGAVSKDHGDGTYTYAFPPFPDTYVAPYNDTAAFDEDDGEWTGQALADGTYTMAMWFRWSYTVDGEGFSEVGTRTLNFAFGASPLSTLVREVVTTESCNQCHSELQAHGGSRRTAELCVMCHTNGAEDRNTGGATPGASIAWNIMVHKIHNGSHLPSVLGVTTAATGERVYDADPVPYELVGFGNNVHDYSHVEFPAWPNFASPMPRDLGYGSLTSGEQALEDQMRSGVTSCALCHGDPDGDEGPLEAPAQGDLAYTNPTRNACGSCHDDWVFDELYTANGQTMPGQVDDQNCAFCHDVSGGPLAVIDGHRHPLQDPSISTGVHFDLLSVVEAGVGADMDGTVDPGEKVAVTFTITDDAGGAIDPNDLDRHNVMLAGPSGNMNVLTPEMSIPAELLAGSPPYTVNVPMAVRFEEIGTATGGVDVFTTEFTPHWEGSGAATSVFEVTGPTGGGGSSTLAAEVVAPVNYVDVADATGFARDDHLAIVGATTEYLVVQTVEGNRLWFSSPYTTGYPVGPREDHPSGTVVIEVDVAERTVDVDYSLAASTGTVTELAGFGDGNPILASYTTDFVLPSTYGLALNAGPDLGELSGTWAGKSMVSGTYSLGMWGHVNRTVTKYGESQTYRDGARGVRLEFLVGSESTLDPWNNIVGEESCYTCHVDIQFHGSNRRGFNSCLMCHGTAGAGDRPQYVAPNAPATDGLTVNFREMLHKIHAGADLAKADSYEIVGYGGGYPNNFSVHTYEGVHFPAMTGGTQDCATCHGEGNTSWFAPVAREHPTEQVFAVQEWTIACGSCHDSDDARAHIETQSSAITGAEACATCHGPGDPWAVDIKHMLR